MAGSADPSIQAREMARPTPVTTSSNASLQRDISSHRIRFSTPPSSLCASSPAFSRSPDVPRRVKEPPETSSALAILAAVCSSPSVRWDGIKHRYGEGRGKSIWSRDMRMPHDPSCQTHIVDLSSLPACGERHFTLQDAMQEDLECYGMDDVQKKVPVPENSMHYPGIEDEDDEDVPVRRDQEDEGYFSELPSSPPTLSFSSPRNEASFDSSVLSERSSVLPSSPPRTVYDHKALYAATIGPSHDVDAVSPIASTHPPREGPEDRRPSVASWEGAVFIDTTKQAEAHSTTDCEPTCTPFLSPLQAPEPLSLPCIGLSFSPLSPLMSPLSEIKDEEPSSPCASVISHAVSPLSPNPDTDENTGCLTKSRTAGRRATIVIGTKFRRGGGSTLPKEKQRSGTAPPDSTPCKQSRHSSPFTPCTVQARRRSLSPSACSDPLLSPTMAYEKRKLACKKKYDSQVTKTSSTSRLKRPLESLHPNTYSDARKRKKGKSSVMRPEMPSTNDDIACGLRALSAKEVIDLPMTGFLVETLALSRVSAITAPELLRAVLKSQPHLSEERSEESWLDFVYHILQKVRMFGRIERSGTDAADRPLEDQWFYIPENDEERGRAELLKGLMPKKRDVTKRSKQYYFEPIQKLSRWDPEDD